MSAETYRDERCEFRCWCEAEGCDWEESIMGRSQSSTALFGHGLRTGHTETYREEQDR